MKRNFISILFVLIFSSQLFGQGETYNWCFGDSSHINFAGGLAVTQPFSGTQSIELNATISDKNGNLLFYITSPSQNGQHLNLINRNHQIMLNGDSIYGYSSSTNGAMIIPFPYDSNKYYIFTNRLDNTLTHHFHLYGSVVDMSLNGGYGAVIQKNDLVLNQPVCEKMAAVKHGNGKDWWVLFHNNDTSLFYVFLIDSLGIQNPIVQSIGTTYRFYNFNYIPPVKGFSGEMVFSNDGSKLIAVSLSIIDYFQFDRCTGILSNYQNLAAAPFTSVYEDNYYGCAFSPNDSILYISMIGGDIPTHSDLYQFDLSVGNIMGSRQTLYSLVDSTSFGQLEIAPDGKIYVATGHNGFPNYIYDSTSMYLSEIENPDNLGLSCNFQLHSLYLGGHRAFLGLPNMPNYNLGVLNGSSCDTITDIHTAENPIMKFEIYPNPFNSSVSLDIKTIEIKHLNIIIKNILGQPVFIKDDYNLIGTYSETFDLYNLEKGIYLLDVKLNGVRIIRKLIKQ